MLATIIYVIFNLRVVQINLQLYCERQLHNYERLYRLNQIAGFIICMYHRVYVVYRCELFLWGCVQVFLFAYNRGSGYSTLQCIIASGRMDSVLDNVDNLRYLRLCACAWLIC